MDMDLGVDTILSLVYRSAAADGSWNPALSGMVDLFDATAVSLRISFRGQNPQQFHFASGQKVKREILDEWEKTQRAVATGPTPSLGAVQFRYYVEELPTHPVTRELLECGVAFAVAHCFDSHDGGDYVLSVSRNLGSPAFSSAEVDALKRIGTHFREAISLRREMLRANLTSRFQGQALDRLGIAGILVDPFGNVMSMNSGAQQLLSSMDCLLYRHDRLVAVNRSDDKELQEHIRRIHAGEVAEGETFAMSLERLDGGRPVGLIIHCARSMCLASHRVENCALLFVRDSEANLAIETALMQKLFSFTPAEASLAMGLASGQRLEEIEDKMRIRHNTARAHLRSIFVKADVTRQAELVCLLANSVAPLARRTDEVRTAA